MATLFNFNTHVKLLVAFDFPSLSSNRADPSSSLRKGLRRVGRSRRIRSSSSPSTTAPAASRALSGSTSPSLLTSRGGAHRLFDQLPKRRSAGRSRESPDTEDPCSSRFPLEPDPDAQVLHWLDCARLAWRCYDKFSKTLA